MKVVVVANHKGGVGKSTLVVHMAHYAADGGARVLVVDLDAQGNSTHTLSGYRSPIDASALFGPEPADLTRGDPGIDLIGATASLIDLDRAAPDAVPLLGARLARMRAGYDLCVIDTAPAAGLRMVAALTAADYVVSPIELEAYSIQGTQSMLKMIFGVRERLNPGLRFLGMVPSRFNSHSPAQKAALAQLLREHPDKVLPYPVGLRTSVAEAVSSGVPVWKLGKTSAREAAREMKALLAAIMIRIGGVGND